METTALFEANLAQEVTLVILDVVEHILGMVVENYALAAGMLLLT